MNVKCLRMAAVTAPLDNTLKRHISIHYEQWRYTLVSRVFHITESLLNLKGVN